MVLDVDGPAVALGVLGGGLGAGGVANLSLTCTVLATSLLRDSREERGGLTHSRPVNVEFLRRGRLVVQVERAVVDVEGGGLLLGTSAAGVLRLQAGEEAALGCVEARVLDTAAGMDGDDAKGLLGLLLGGSREGCSGGSGGRGEDEVLELHFGGGMELSKKSVMNLIVM